MNPNFNVSYDIAQARIADLRHQARREALARAARPGPQPNRFRISVRLRRRAQRPRPAGTGPRRVRSAGTWLTTPGAAPWSR